MTYVLVLLNSVLFCLKGCSDYGKCKNIPLLVVKRNIQHVPLGKRAGFRPAQSKYPVLCSSGGSFMQHGPPGMADAVLTLYNHLT